MSKQLLAYRSTGTVEHSLRMHVSANPDSRAEVCADKKADSLRINLLGSDFNVLLRMTYSKQCAGAHVVAAV